MKIFFCFLVVFFLNKTCLAGSPLPGGDKYRCRVKAELISFPYMEIKQECEKLKKKLEIQKTERYKKCLNSNISYENCLQEVLIRSQAPYSKRITKKIKVKVLNSSGGYCKEISLLKNEILAYPFSFTVDDGSDEILRNSGWALSENCKLTCDEINKKFKSKDKIRFSTYEGELCYIEKYVQNDYNYQEKNFDMDALVDTLKGALTFPSRSIPRSIPQNKCQIAGKIISFPYDQIKKACKKDKKEYQTRRTKYYKDCINKGKFHKVCQTEWLQNNYHKEMVKSPAISTNVEFKVSETETYFNKKNCEKYENEVLNLPINFYNTYDYVYARISSDVPCPSHCETVLVSQYNKYTKNKSKLLVNLFDDISS